MRSSDLSQDRINKIKLELTRPLNFLSRSARYMERAFPPDDRLAMAMIAAQKAVQDLAAIVQAVDRENRLARERK